MFERMLKPAISIDIKAPPYNVCLAKTFTSSAGVKLAGRTVLNHCLIVGAVARSILARMPGWLRDELYPEGSELVAASHDIGKISPTFQTKICRAAGNTIPGLVVVPNPESEAQWGGHGGVSQATTKSLSAGKFIPEIVGQHHGYSPNLGSRISTDEIFGGHNWERERILCLDALKSLLNVEWPIIKNNAQARVISGLTTVSDWIGSGPLFENPNEPWEHNIELALDNAGFTPPKLIQGLGFSDIFGFEPRDIQSKLIEHAVKPGVYILEAPMGLGKTEAALYAAYLAICSGNATGIYFALPTQLTSNKIYERMNSFLNIALSDDNTNKEALLLHSSAWLNYEFGVDGEPGGSWFHYGKRGILAPFAVGTIDQALMAVMNVKHGFVRAFGLAGKVVILDEVHSYDSYTGTILDTLVEQLRALHCTVIILSATLTHERRTTLLKKEPHSVQYPLITSSTSGNNLIETHVSSAASMDVEINVKNDQRVAINEAISRASQGQQVLWIENTVAEAQKVYKVIAARTAGEDIETGLLHSRFIKYDRENIEKKWVSYYGKGDPATRTKHGRILVGTQVLEQSIDIDSDFLVTKICPTDMLLQRIGRLWRHSNTIRPIRAKCEAWILSPTLSSAIKDAEQAFGSTAFVYSPYILCRSLEVWAKVDVLRLPDMIRPLIEETYQERFETNELQTYKNKLEREREKLQQLAFTGLSHGFSTVTDANVRTRYSEEDTIDVLVVRDFSRIVTEAGPIIRIEFINGESIDLNSQAPCKKMRRAKSVILNKNMVKVRYSIAPEPLDHSQLAGLDHYIYLGNKEFDEPLLRIAKVLANDELSQINGNTIASKNKLCYNAVLGYQAEK